MTDVLLLMAGSLIGIVLSRVSRTFIEPRLIDWWKSRKINNGSQTEGP